LKDANVETTVRDVGAALAEMVTRIGTRDRGSLAAQVLERSYPR
jgi:hypothetical protein